MNIRTYLFALLVCSLAASVQAGNLSAIVLAGSPNAVERGHVVCQHRLEGSLRQLGFSVLDNHMDPCRADLVVVVGRDHPRDKRTISVSYEQPMHLKMIRPKGPVAGEDDCKSGNMLGHALADLELVGRSGGSVSAALADGCQQIDKIVQTRVQQAMSTMLLEPGRTTLTLRWRGRLQPMPLLKVTPFLQEQVGAPPELLSSDAQHCRFAFHLDDPHGVFKERVQRFLLRHWSIQSSSGNPLRGGRKVEFQLGKKEGC